ncbi:hypothetical protein ABRZ10_07135 [Castellaniella ginsengisoli]|uniref:Uncharacterized protein n=1 Tax=Castellaniella ginsengisoli TaxID=546114 RepID=A0AB39FBH4_9BURK
MQIVEPHRAPRTVGPHNGRVTACEKERREALWMPVFVDAPTAGWDVQTIPCGPLWLRVCRVPFTVPAPARGLDDLIYPEIPDS